MRFLRFRIRAWMILVALAACALGGYVGLLRLGYHEMERKEISYLTEMAGLEKDHERKLRELAARIRRGDERDADGINLTDRVFQELQIDQWGATSKVVGAWKTKPSSPERTALALKSTDFAADYSAYLAALKELWIRDLKLGRGGRIVTNDELPPPPMPADLIDGP